MTDSSILMDFNDWLKFDSTDSEEREAHRVAFSVSPACDHIIRNDPLENIDLPEVVIDFNYWINFVIMVNMVSWRRNKKINPISRLKIMIFKLIRHLQIRHCPTTVIITRPDLDKADYDSWKQKQARLVKTGRVDPIYYHKRQILEMFADSGAVIRVASVESELLRYCQRQSVILVTSDENKLLMPRVNHLCKGLYYSKEGLNFTKYIPNNPKLSQSRIWLPLWRPGDESKCYKGSYLISALAASTKNRMNENIATKELRQWVLATKGIANQTEIHPIRDHDEIKFVSLKLIAKPPPSWVKRIRSKQALDILIGKLSTALSQKYGFDSEQIYWPVADALTSTVGMSLYNVVERRFDD